ncbi:MAG: hypothetical protein AAF914_05355 [Pseudomonadota bacterium]
MKLKVSQDARGGADALFAALTDFTAAEADLRDRGVEIARASRWEAPAIGAGWTGRGTFRGRTRRFDAEIAALEPGRMLAIAAKIGGLRVAHETRLVPLGADVTRVNVATDLRPDTLSARLLVQSLKVGRARALRRMQRWLDQEVQRLEARAAAS